MPPHPPRSRPAAAKDPFELRPARVHEAEGPGRRGFALFQALRHPGAVVWIVPAQETARPLPQGLPPGLGPRLLIAEARSEADLLWATEEALRTGTPGLVLAEPSRPLSLTAGRRLQLAAEAGACTGLLLIRDGQGSPATETRWHCSQLALAGTGPDTAGDSTGHRWQRNKNKRGTTGLWTVHWDGASTAFDMVSEARE